MQLIRDWRINGGSSPFGTRCWTGHWTALDWPAAEKARIFDRVLALSASQLFSLSSSSAADIAFSLLPPSFSPHNTHDFPGPGELILPSLSFD